MRKSHHQLQARLAECLLAELSGLSGKHAKKLRKTIGSATKKLVRKYAKLEAREHKAHPQARPAAAKPTPEKMVTRTVKAASQPAPAKRPTPAPRGAEKNQPLQKRQPKHPATRRASPMLRPDLPTVVGH